MRIGPFKIGRGKSEDYDCTEVAQDCSDYVDGDLTPTQLARLRAHLDDCPDCDTFVESFRTTVTTLNDLPRKQPPADLQDRIRSSIERERSN